MTKFFKAPINILWLLPLMFAIAQLIAINTWGCNLPYFDEWDYIGSDGLVSTLSWDWLFTQHNEHRIIPTKILMWSLFHFNGWNHLLNLSINFGLYLVLVGLLCVQASKSVRRFYFIIPLSAVLLFSPLNAENHLWGFQSQFHFALIFQIIAVFIGTDPNPTFKKAILAALFSILAMYSMSFGVAMQAASIILLNIYWLWNGCKQNLKKLLVFDFLTLSSLAYWLAYYHKPGHHPDPLLPWTAQFWQYFLNLISFGFGYTSFDIWIGILILGIISIGILLCLFFDRSSYSIAWCLLGITALTALCTISMGRAAFGLNASKSSRYVEIGMVLMFASQMIWLRVAQLNKNRALALPALFLFGISFIGYFNDWNTNPYLEKFQQEQASFTCLKSNLDGTQDFTCPSLYHSPMRAKLNFAFEHQFDLCRELKKSEL